MISSRIFSKYFSLVLFSAMLMSNTLSASTCDPAVDVCLSLDEQGNLNYSSTQDIAGFQWNHDGCVSSASGGAAQNAGFTVSVSSGVVLGFSFTGSIL